MANPSSPRRRRPFQLTRLVLALGGVALLVAAATGGPADVAERPSPPDAGVALSVGVDDGTLLVATGDSFDLLVLDADAVIVDGQGRALALADVHEGDRVVYVVAPWAGMSLAPALRDLGPAAPSLADGRS